MPPRHVENYSTTKLKGTLVCKYVIVGYVWVQKVILILFVPPPCFRLLCVFGQQCVFANFACLYSSGRSIFEPRRT